MLGFKTNFTATNKDRHKNYHISKNEKNVKLA